jgi:hypothetical protein
MLLAYALGYESSGLGRGFDQSLQGVGEVAVQQMCDAQQPRTVCVGREGVQLFGRQQRGFRLLPADAQQALSAEQRAAAMDGDHQGQVASAAAADVVQSLAGATGGASEIGGRGRPGQVLLHGFGLGASSVFEIEDDIFQFLADFADRILLTTKRL